MSCLYLTLLEHFYTTVLLFDSSSTICGHFPYTFGQDWTFQGHAWTRLNVSLLHLLLLLSLLRIDVEENTTFLQFSLNSLCLVNILLLIWLNVFSVLFSLSKFSILNHKIHNEIANIQSDLCISSEPCKLISINCLIFFLFLSSCIICYHIWKINIIIKSRILLCPSPIIFRNDCVYVFSGVVSLFRGSCHYPCSIASLKWKTDISCLFRYLLIPRSNN